MRKIYFVGILAACLLIFGIIPSYANITSQNYWIIDQYPHYATLYVFTSDNTTVRFSDGNSVLSTRFVPSKQIMAYSLTDLGFSADNFYYMEILADKPIMVNLSDRYSDMVDVRPPTSLKSHYYFPLQQSSPEDDILAIYSPTTTSVNIRGHQFTKPIETNVTVSGLQTFNVAELLDLNFYGYSIEIRSNTPVAATVSDDGLQWYDSRYPFGLFGGYLGRSSLASEYYYVNYYDNFTSFYTFTPTLLTFLDESGTPVGSYNSMGPESFYLYYTAIGYLASPGTATFINVEGSAPFASNYYSSEESITSGASYIGANSGNATMALYSTTPTTVSVVNSLTGQNMALNVPAYSVISKPLLDLGIFSTGPFVADIRASAPIFQEISIRASGSIAGHVRSQLQQYSLTHPLIDVLFDVDPDTLNLKSKGKYITAYIGLPLGFDVRNIEISSLKLVNSEDISIPAELSPNGIDDYDNDGTLDLMVKFSREAVQAMVAVGDQELKIIGVLSNGTPFEGTDIIRVIEKGILHTDEPNPASVVN